MIDKQVILDYKEHERLLECEKAFKENAVYIEYKGYLSNYLEYSVEYKPTALYSFVVNKKGTLPKQLEDTLLNILNTNQNALEKIEAEIKIREREYEEFGKVHNFSFWKRLKFVFTGKI